MRSFKHPEAAPKLDKGKGKAVYLNPVSSGHDSWASPGYAAGPSGESPVSQEARPFGGDDNFNNGLSAELLGGDHSVTNELSDRDSNIANKLSMQPLDSGSNIRDELTELAEQLNGCYNIRDDLEDLAEPLDGYYNANEGLLVDLLDDGDMDLTGLSMEPLKPDNTVANKMPAELLVSNEQLVDLFDNDNHVSNELSADLLDSDNYISNEAKPLGSDGVVVSESITELLADRNNEFAD